MESAAFNLYQNLSVVRPSTLVAFGLSNKWLPIVLPLLFLRALPRALSRRTTVLLLQDGVLGPLGRILGAFSGKPVVIIVHGLEVTHAGPLHQRLMAWSLPHMTHIIAVSENTAKIIQERFPDVPVTVINNGVPDDFHTSDTRDVMNAKLAHLTGLDVERLRKARILATVGRLVPRKGVSWFVSDVFASLSNDYLYLIVGAGPEREHIEDAVSASPAGMRIVMLGRIGQDELNLIYTRADVFVMPNLRVEGDVEGFGIAALEASSAGTPVVAADVDGISDAVRENGNGTLVATKDTKGFVAAISATDSSFVARERIREFTLSHFSWTSRADDVSSLLDKVASAGRRGAHA
jgi:phosphatidylinositol alpha-1,6-mannosyltransferase